MHDFSSSTFQRKLMWQISDVIKNVWFCLKNRLRFHLDVIKKCVNRSVKRIGWGFCPIRNLLLAVYISHYTIPSTELGAIDLCNGMNPINLITPSLLFYCLCFYRYIIIFIDEHIYCPESCLKKPYFLDLIFCVKL